MEDKTIQLPDMEYFGYGNVYSGSRKSFNYKIVPKDGMLHTVIWFGKLCSDQSEAASSQEYPLDATGLSELTSWLNEQFGQFVQED